MNGRRGIEKECLLVSMAIGPRTAIVNVLTVLETQNLEPNRTILFSTAGLNDILLYGCQGWNGDSDRSPAEAGKQGLVIFWMRAGRTGNRRKAQTLFVGIRRHVTSPAAKVTCEQILTLKMVIKIKSHASLLMGNEHGAGLLDHNRSISRRKVVHVFGSQIVEGGKLELEGADRRY